MAIKIGDALLKLGLDKTEFDSAMTKMGENIQSSMKKLQDGLRIGGAAFTAFGATGLKMVSTARDLNAQLGQTGLTIGVSAKDMRDLALATTDVTFPLESVTKTFDLLARAGIKNTAEMKASAKAFDSLGDATGSSADVMADLLLPAFKLFGKELPTTSKELDKFTWLTKHTIVDMSDFGTLLTRMAPYMDTLNMSMEDAIATLAALSEHGITGTAATLKLRTAITQAATSGEDLTTILGLTTDEIDKYKGEMEKAVGITDEYASVANTQFGIMDKVKQKFQEISLAAGSLLTPLEPLLAIMTALGPVMIFLSSQIGRQTVIWIHHNAVVMAASIAHGVLQASILGPVGIIVALVTLGIALTMADAKFKVYQDTVTATNTALKESISPLQTTTASLWKKIAAERELYSVEKGSVGTLSELTKQVKIQTDALELANQKLKEAQADYDKTKKDAAGYGAEVTSLTRKLGDAEYHLGKAKDALTKVQAAYDKATQKVSDFENAISDANNELNRLSTPRLEGMQKYEDQIFDITQQINKLELLKLGPSVDENELNRLNEKTDALENQRRQLELTRDIEFDPLLKAAREGVETVQGLNIEIAPQAVLDRIAELARKLGPEGELGKGLRDAQADLAKQNGLLIEQKTIVEGWETIIKGYNDRLGDISHSIQGILDKKEDEIKNITEVRDALVDLTDTATAKLKAVQAQADGTFTEFNAGLKSAKALYDSLISKTITIITKYVTGGETVAPVPSEERYAFPGFAKGGIIPEPTLLYGLRSMRPYAVAGEAGREYITPARDTGYRTANIIIQLDGRTIAQEIGQPLVDLIYARTGLRR